MKRYAPFSGPDLRRRPPSVIEGAADPPSDDLPPIEQFLDEFPSIDDYLAAVEPEFETPAVAVATEAPVSASPGHDAEGWAVTEWQSYDWSGLAALGHDPATSAEAESNWNATQWSEEGGESAQLGDSLSFSGSAGAGAHEVATALDDIARRIRSGELAIDQFRGSPPEAAMAAALAALLRLRG